MPPLRRHWDTLMQLLRLPVAHLAFEQQRAPEAIRATYRHFTKRHPRYKLIGNKTMGAALIDLGALAHRDGYLAHIAGKNGGAHHARRARTRGYVCTEIDRNAYVDEIHAINTSLASRQGRPMDASYLAKRQQFDTEPHFRYFGALDAQGRLAAYANVGQFGNFAAFSQLIGLRNNDGAMHLLVVEIVCRLLDEGAVRYIMYDTYFGAQSGLQNFKTMLGFSPYRAKYSLR